MIHVAPNNDAGRVCRAMARFPGGVSCETLGAKMARCREKCPPADVGRIDPRRVDVDASHYAAKAAKHEKWRASAKAAELAATAKVNTIMRELTRAGYVEPLGPPTVDAAKITTLPPLSSAEQKIVARLQSKPATRAELKLSGSGNRAYQRLVSVGVIVAPSGRVLTQKGRDVVASWGES